MLRKVGETVVNELYDYFSSDNYNPRNQEHIDLVQNELKAFEASRDALYSTDSKITAGIVFNSLLIMSGTIMGTIGTIALVAYVAQYADRKETAAKFQEQLQKTVDLYKWCAAKDPEALAKSDPNFAALSKAVAPHLNWKDSEMKHLETIAKPYIGFFNGAVGKAYSMAYGYQQAEQQSETRPTMKV